jgi:hypothetical protein
VLRAARSSNYGAIVCADGGTYERRRFQLAEPVDGAFGIADLNTIICTVSIFERSTDDGAVECADCGTDERRRIQLAEPVDGAFCGTVWIAELRAERSTDATIFKPWGCLG